MSADAAMTPRPDWRPDYPTSKVSGFQRAYNDSSFAGTLLKAANQEGADLPHLRQLWSDKYPDGPIPHRLQETRVKTVEEYTKKDGHQRVHVRQFCPLREHATSFRAADDGAADTSAVLGAVQGFFDEHTGGCLHLDPVVSGLHGCVCLQPREQAHSQPYLHLPSACTERPGHLQKGEEREEVRTGLELGRAEVLGNLPSRCV